MPGPRRRWRTFIALFVAGVLVTSAIPVAALLAPGGRGGTVDDAGMWTHDTPPDIGIEVTEATRGFTSTGAVTLNLGRGSLILPQADGIAWGFGDGPCGYGWVVYLPQGATVCFDEEGGTVQVRADNAADHALAEALASAIPAYRRVWEGAST